MIYRVAINPPSVLVHKVHDLSVRRSRGTMTDHKSERLQHVGKFLGESLQGGVVQTARQHRTDQYTSHLRDIFPNALGKHS